MAANIKTLKEDNGDITYPQTVASAVANANGGTVQSFLDAGVTAEEIAATSAITTSTMSSMVGWSRSVVSCTLTSQTNTSWSKTVQINKIQWGNGVVEFCCNNLDTTFGASTGGPKNIIVTWPTSFSSVYRFVGNICFSGNTDAYQTHVTSNGVRADMWVNRGAGSTVQNIIISFSIVGVLSS